MRWNSGAFPEIWNDRHRETDRVARLKAILRPEFVAEVGWDGEREILAPPRNHPLVGTPKCAVLDCDGRVSSLRVGLCSVCKSRLTAAGVPLDEFIMLPRRKGSGHVRTCEVADCERPTRCRAGLCDAHDRQWRRKYRHLGVAEFLQVPELEPLASFGPCRVMSCIRQADQGKPGLCRPHRNRWRSHLRAHPRSALQEWIRSADPIEIDHMAILRGLSEQIRLELLVGLQARGDAGIATRLDTLRCLVRTVRAEQVKSVVDVDPAAIRQSRIDTRALLRAFRETLRRALSTPETERTKDIWDLAVFGMSGSLNFTAISQYWLRETAKRWAEHDLPVHRGSQSSQTARAVVAAVAELSESLRLSRDDHGEMAPELGRRDVVTVTNRLAYKQRSGAISSSTRLARCRAIRRFLNDIRGFGLTGPGYPAYGLPDDVLFIRSDIPSEPLSKRNGRALPGWVTDVVIANLPVLEERCDLLRRRLVELMLDTGRRPIELCKLPLNCLESDATGKPVLIYTDFKNNRTGRRLPIWEETAQIIRDQQAFVRSRFPDTPLSQLALFPRDTANRSGTKPAEESSFSNGHRRFINSIAHLFSREVIGGNGQPYTEHFDHMAIVPYCYRHNYAQRLADNGVPPDVLRDLMDHRSMQTTLTYYRVTERRIREAVDRVAAHQFDGSGGRVYRGVSKLLDDEHLRLRIGQVAVPFGICTEPSNVKAGGAACPSRYRCVGCGHFRTDASYLPELKSYLQQLLSDQERRRVFSAPAIAAESAPDEGEITKLRRLIRRVEADLDHLSEEDRVLINGAIKAVRETRQTVHLGMPRVGSDEPTEFG